MLQGIMLGIEKNMINVKKIIQVLMKYFKRKKIQKDNIMYYLIYQSFCNIKEITKKQQIK